MFTAALTLPRMSTATKLDLLDIGFWDSYVYDELLAKRGRPPGVLDTSRDGYPATLYARKQVCDGWDTFVAIIIIVRSSADRLCLNQLGSNPLEHTFGRGRIGCRDVHPMRELIDSFASEGCDLVVKEFLNLMARPRRRTSVGVDCAAFSASGSSVFKRPARIMAISLLIRIGFDMGPLAREIQSNVPDAWKELTNIPGFRRSGIGESPAGKIPPERKGGAKKLSSDQIFLGVISAPRPLHMITMPANMEHILAPIYR
jgi:hypothetical protein